MSKGEIIDFVVLRIENELDKYEKTETIPHTVLEGTYSINEIRDHYYHKLQPRYQKLADTLYKDYRKHISRNIGSLRKALRREYTALVNNLATDHDSFRFKEITNLYRPTMNPIRALYYQTRELFRRFNPEDPHHYWLKDLITDREYNNIILDELPVGQWTTPYKEYLETIQYDNDSKKNVIVGFTNNNFIYSSFHFVNSNNTNFI